MSKTMKLSELRKRYEYICTECITKFSNKHGYEFTGWVGNDIGDVAEFIGQYYFTMTDIYYDLNKKCPKGLIFKWQDDCIENNGKVINFRSYAMGMRFEHLNK